MARLGLGGLWKCVFANDWDKRKAAAYRAYFGDGTELRIRDVRSLSPALLPGTADLAWASFPCQDLSLAGSGAGLNGKRSGTFAPFWKLIQGLATENRHPRLVVLENVVGAITSHKGRDFSTLIQTVAESGYSVGPLVINAVHFVPQSRPRLFIVAVRHSVPIPCKLVADSPTRWHSTSLIRAYRSLGSNLKDYWMWWNLPEPPKKFVPPLSSLIEEEPIGVSWHSPEETARLISLMSPLNRKKVEEAQKTKRRQIGTIYKRTRPLPGRLLGKRVQRAEIRFDEVSGCLRTPVGGSSRQIVLIVEGKHMKSRLISPREAARLMGVPDGYPTPSNYNDAYHLFGDGLVVPVVEWLERHLLRPLGLQNKAEQVA